MRRPPSVEGVSFHLDLEVNLIPFGIMQGRPGEGAGFCKERGVVNRLG